MIVLVGANVARGSALAVADPREAGDADCSGHTTAGDALIDLRYVANPNDKLSCLGAGNVFCNDDITLADVTAILKFASGLPTNMPTPCPQIGDEFANHAISQGELTIKGTFSGDFDDGVANTDPGDYDVYWDQTSETIRAMYPSAGARLALVAGRTFDDIALPYLYSRVYTTDPINGNDDATNRLSDGSIFAVQTTRGNYTKALVTHYGYDITIKWVTYSPEP